MGAEISRLFGENQTSAGLLPMLGMGRDIPNGKMKLRGGKLDVDWRLEDSDTFFQGVRETMKSISDELGARFSDPLGRLNRVVTVHPLGGCPRRSPLRVAAVPLFFGIRRGLLRIPIGGV
jgi:cholesterol oxidase